MPEGPEVRRAADTLHAALAGKPVVALSARTKAARAWLDAHPDAFPGRRIERVWSHGKILVGQTDGGGGESAFFASHFMMWGRWHVVTPDDEMAVVRDRRERARIEVPDAVAVLFSAPVFEVGVGDPYAHVAHLPTLGPDVLPPGGPGAYDAAAVRERMLAHPDRTVGAVLLDQTVLAGLGNYLRAEILWTCRIDPWRTVGRLEPEEWDALDREIPRISDLAYRAGGRTVSEDVQARMVSEPGMTYNGPQEWSTRHAVFRRTNLPCLRCGGPVRQKRQTTREAVAGENPAGDGAANGDADGTSAKERIIYFCPDCQGTTVSLPRAKPRQIEPAAAIDRADESDAVGPDLDA